MSRRPYRLSAGGRAIDRDETLTFSFDGARMTGHPGDTLASALLANGVRVVGRSFKYHRPRGLLAAGSDEPNALVTVGELGRHEPDLRATQVELFDGLVAASQNNWPNLAIDVGQVNSWASRLIPAGFYYKTFMWPSRLWPVYEHFIRRAAGLGTAPKERDPDHYEQIHVTCDVLVAGGGIAGLAAARAVAASGKRVILADETPHLGGFADSAGGLIDGASQADWAAGAAAELAAAGNVHVLTRTTVAGHYDHNWVLMLERVADHDPDLARNGAPRHRLWKVRAGHVIVATGAIERPLTFAGNDRPGIMLASAARIYVNRYGVSPGRRCVVFTNNDDAYRTAITLARAGVSVARIVDCRQDHASPLADQARAEGLVVTSGRVITKVETSLGGMAIEGVRIARLRSSGRLEAPEERIECDFVASSGGWNPAVHLFSHCGGKLAFDEALQAFRPVTNPQALSVVGAANGTFGLQAILDEATRTGAAVAGGPAPDAPRATSEAETALHPLWFVPSFGAANEGNKHFVDFQNDVTAADLELAAREGYRSVEHFKRYTTLGMATDQGKTSNINALGIMADVLNAPIPKIGTTTFRPPYTPISFGAIAGSKARNLFLPVRRTPMWSWHVEHGADFEPVGQWRRPYCYRRGNEDRRAAVNREILAVRQKVGLIDASTLGKIELKGPDAAKLLDRVYSNTFSTLDVGRCRYGLMMNENGFLFDDGVTVRLGTNHYLVHTTSGNADRIHAWFEEWLQTEWTDLKVFVTPVTEQWAQFGIAGPKARDLLEKLEGTIDFSNEAFPFMTMKAGTLEGVTARVFRISFSGELSYEIAVPANRGLGLWNALIEAGEEFDIEPYGTEALHVLRAEKGFIAIGDETDGTVTPLDLGLNWAVSKKKPDYIGKRSLERTYLAGPDRKELVGLLTEDPQTVLPDGAYAVEAVKPKPPMIMIGQVSSSYWSPTLKRSIALGLIRNGRARKGEIISFPLEDRVVKARIVDPVFYDQEGKRLNG